MTPLVALILFSSASYQIDDTLLADFSSLDGWTISGNAFNNRAVRGLSGNTRHTYLCSYSTSNANTGIALSPQFALENARPYISFEICGGDDARNTCVNLLVGGKIVRTASGDRSLAFKARTWNIAEFAGSQAQLQVVDSSTAPQWGFILLGNVVSSARPHNIPEESLYHLETIPKEIRTLSLEEDVPGMHGQIIFPIPPSDPTQKILACRLDVVTSEGLAEATPISDTSALRKPVLSAHIESARPVHIAASVRVQFFDTRLVYGSRQVELSPLTDTARKYYLDERWPSEADHAWWKSLLKIADLLRHENETDVEFAARALRFLGSNFSYVIPDELPEYKAAVARYGASANDHFTMESHSGECMRLSGIYAQILRESGIPVRQVSGNWVEGDHGHHLRDLIWLRGVGWVPVEPTRTVTEPASRRNLDYFGFWGGYFLSGNESIDFHVPWGSNYFNIGTLDTVWYLHDDGRFTMATAKLR